jgi:hypothetical protein
VSGATAVLSLVRAAGVRLRVDEVGRLKVVGRPELVPPAILVGLRMHKAEIVALLRADDLGQATNDDSSPPGPDQPCHGCDPPPDPDDPPRNRSPGPTGDAQRRDSVPAHPTEPLGSTVRPGAFPVPKNESSLAAPPDPATAPIGRCRVCGWIAPLSARRMCWPCSPAAPPDTAPAEDPPAQAVDPPPWTDDREWIWRRRIAGPTLLDREPVLRAWLAATPPQPLPRCLAAVELARIAREHGITVEIERLLAASGRAAATPSKPPMTAKS